jgi:hypothetical protein
MEEDEARSICGMYRREMHIKFWLENLTERIIWKT